MSQPPCSVTEPKKVTFKFNNMSEERCKYCGNSLGHLEIYEVCPCTVKNQSVKQQNKMKEKRTTFLSGKKWADGKFATREEIFYLKEQLKFNDPEKEIPLELAELIETSINYLALVIIRYSQSEFCNDYYDSVTNLTDIGSWLDKHNKHHKLGRYFSLQTK